MPSTVISGFSITFSSGYSPVSLHADGEDKILLPGGIQSVHDVVDQDIVLGPAILRQLKDVHKLLAGKAVKSHVVEHPRPAVEVPAVVVKGVGSVTKGLQGCGRALAGRFLQDRFIGIFPGPKYRRFIPVSTSNSVLAVPAPTEGTLK